MRVRIRVVDGREFLTDVDMTWADFVAMVVRNGFYAMDEMWISAHFICTMQPVPLPANNVVTMKAKIMGPTLVIPPESGPVSGVIFTGQSVVEPSSDAPS